MKELAGLSSFVLLHSAAVRRSWTLSSSVLMGVKQFFCDDYVLIIE